MVEEWKNVCGYEGLYKISNCGRVYSCERDVIKSNGIIQHRNGKFLVPITNCDGYRVVKLLKNGVRKSVAVHILVAIHFVNKPIDWFNLEVNHKDCNRANNVYTNLEWCTHKDNIAHSASLGHYKHFGKDNANYGGTKLKNFYNANPLAAKEILARPGKQNGRCVKIKMIFPDGHSKNFDYIGECADYLKNECGINAQIASIRTNIRAQMKKGRPYKGFMFVEL